MRKALAVTFLSVIFAVSGPVSAQANKSERFLGDITTTFRLTGSDKIRIEAFDDPKVKGVTCFTSMAVTGGISGTLGLAEDTSDVSLSCRQTGPISFTVPLKKGEDVFEKSRSLVFKTLKVERFYDDVTNTLVYVSSSRKVIKGSPKNSIGTVTIMPWPEGETARPTFK